MLAFDSNGKSIFDVRLLPKEACRCYHMQWCQRDPPDVFLRDVGSVFSNLAGHV